MSYNIQDLVNNFRGCSTATVGCLTICTANVWLQAATGSIGGYWDGYTATMGQYSLLNTMPATMRLYAAIGGYWDSYTATVGQLHGYCGTANCMAGYSAAIGGYWDCYATTMGQYSLLNTMPATMRLDAAIGGYWDSYTATVGQLVVWPATMRLQAATGTATQLLWDIIHS